MIDAELLMMLRCPLEGDQLVLADESLVQRINRAIDAGSAHDRLDQKVSEPIQGGLVAASGDWIYPIRGGIPSLIAEEAIEMTKFQDPLPEEMDPATDG